MRKHHLVVAVSFAIAACTAEDPKPTASSRNCSLTDSAQLSGSGLGALRVGASVAAVRAACEVLMDTTLAHGNEGMPERRMAVQIGNDTVEAVVDSGKVFRVELTTPRFRTVDSLGVGTTANTLRAKGGQLAVGDRGVFALLPSHCGLSFQLRGVDPAFGESWTRIADTTSVSRVLAFGCRSGAASG